MVLSERRVVAATSFNPTKSKTTKFIFAMTKSSCTLHPIHTFVAIHASSARLACPVSSHHFASPTMGRDRDRASSKPPPPSSTPAPWPADVRYLETLRFDSSVPAALVNKYAPSKSTKKRHTRADAKRRVAGRVITEDAHPACGQFGLFATKKFKPKEWIVDYHGVVTSSEACSQTSDYTLSFGESNELAVDAAIEGNEARFTNDFRNTGRRQNAKFDSYVDECGDYKLAIFCLADGTIEKGDEILISYGKGFWKHRFGDLEAFRGSNF